MNARLRRVFASDVDLVTGDCDSMKFGEKLFSVGFTPSVYDRGIPGARPLQCLHVNELPPDAATARRTRSALGPHDRGGRERPAAAVPGPAIVDHKSSPNRGRDFSVRGLYTAMLH